MGGKQSHSFDQNQFNSLWERRQTSINGRTLWKNKSDPTKQIEQYPIFANTDDQIQREQSLYDIRRNSSDLVAATHLKQTKKGGLCSNSAQGRLFLQKIPLKLQALQHIPFPDILHLNMNALTGYKKLAKTVGPFRPQQQQIGFNKQGVAKVWLHGDYSISKPASVQQSQYAMVRNILQLIDDNSDRNTTPRQNSSIINYVYRESNEIGFDQAIKSINQYAQKYNNGIIPSNLECIKRVGIDHISKSLTTMRQNGIVTSLNNAPMSNFNTIQVQAPYHTTSNATTNIVPIRSSVVVPSLPQQRIVTSGSTYVPPSLNFTQKINLTNQTTGFKIVAPPKPIEQNIILPTQQTLVKRSSIVNFGNVSNALDNKVSVQPTVNQIQVQQTIRPPIQQIVRQGPAQQNVVFGNRSIVTPVQQLVQPGQRVVVNQSAVQIPNQAIIGNIVPRQVLIHSLPQIIPQQQIIVQQQQVIPQQQLIKQQQIIPQQEIITKQQVIPQQHVISQNQQIFTQTKVNGQQQKITNERESIKQEQNIIKIAVDNNVQISRKNQTVHEQFQVSRQINQNRNLITESSTTATFVQNKNYGLSSREDNFGLNFIQPSSSRFRDVSLQDGKSSSALLAELRNLSTKVYTPNTTANNTYKSYDQSSNYYNNRSSNAYTSEINDSSKGNVSGNYNETGYYNMFNKYATGNQDNLEDNLQMKYSMTQDQYENGQYQNQYQNQQYENQYQNQQYDNQYQNEQYQNQYEQYHNQYENQQYDNHEGQYNVDYDPQILADIQKMRN